MKSFNLKQIKHQSPKNVAGTLPVWEQVSHNSRVWNTPERLCWESAELAACHVAVGTPLDEARYDSWCLKPASILTHGYKRDPHVVASKQNKLPFPPKTHTQMHREASWLVFLLNRWNLFFQQNELYRV